MYSIEINFLKDRVAIPTKGGGRGKRPLPKQALVPLYVGLSIGLLFPAIALGLWGYVQWRTEQVQAEIDARNVELAQLKEKQKQIDSLKAEIEVARSQVNGLASIFGRIKSWSAILQDIRDRVPDRVKVASIKQVEVQPAAAPSPSPSPSPGAAATPPAAATPAPIALTISGFADTYAPVNDFLLTLKKSPLLEAKETRLVSAQLTNFPGTVQQTGKTQVQVELPQVVQYQIQTQLTNLPDPDLLRVLERKGALGLSTRLRAAEGANAAAPAAKSPNVAPTPAATPK
ncbi:PilN domain-containing protein [Oscillatoria sp. FACHB-1406]|uniref:PilN domain-containing protein n=1 Tax=Oscillatoria sp. FACHB-1406 TaxID=2692846 RepID=UPI0016858EE4|nr:PilN domain-containing protein [Oscillatoria sp. FACHB-1406]MBD2577580.1 PilN domain-containing protein [Oscillatoria sp. FACHB-1406]